MPFILQMLIGSIIITVLRACVGGCQQCFVWGVWDYSKMPFNPFGAWGKFACSSMVIFLFRRLGIILDFCGGNGLEEEKPKIIRCGGGENEKTDSVTCVTYVTCVMFHRV